jgi:hypothetical protein
MRRYGTRLWPTFHAVGQEKDEPRLPDPLGLSAGDELVDDALGRVGEVPELGLPQHQRVRVCHRESQLKSYKK